LQAVLADEGYLSQGMEVEREETARSEHPALCRCRIVGRCRWLVYYVGQKQHYWDPSDRFGQATSTDVRLGGMRLGHGIGQLNNTQLDS
jgi:hypothetical protein